MKASKSLTALEMGKPAVPVFRRTLEDRMWTELFPQLASIPAAARQGGGAADRLPCALDDETLFVSLAGKTQMERAVRAVRRPPGRDAGGIDEALEKARPERRCGDCHDRRCVSPALQLVVSETMKETFDQFEHVTLRIRGGKEVEFILQAKGKSSDLGRELAGKSEKGIKALRGNLDGSRAGGASSSTPCSRRWHRPQGRRGDSDRQAFREGRPETGSGDSGKEGAVKPVDGRRTRWCNVAGVTIVHPCP